LENKKVAKDFGKKFATGSSVTKIASGGEFCLFCKMDEDWVILWELKKRWKRVPRLEAGGMNLEGHADI